MQWLRQVELFWLLPSSHGYRLLSHTLQSKLAMHATQHSHTATQPVQHQHVSLDCISR